MDKVYSYIKKEKKINDLEYEFIQKFIKTRKKEKMTQQKISESANILRETVAKIETYMSSPQVNTLIKLLEPMGYTLDIVKIKKDDK